MSDHQDLRPEPQRGSGRGLTLGAAIASAVLLLTIGVVFILTALGELPPVWYVVAGISVGILLILATMSFALIQAERAKAERIAIDNRISQLDGVESSPPQTDSPGITRLNQTRPSVDALIARNQAQMDKYDLQARTTMQVANISALVAMFVGLAMLIAGMVVTMVLGAAAERFVFAGLSALGAAVSAFIARTFLVNARRAAESAMFYYRTPSVSGYLLSAERIAESLPEDVRDEQKALIIAAALKQAEVVGARAEPSGK